MKAVLHTCRAMHASLPGKADGQQSAFCHCERASGHLWSSLNVSGATCDPTLNHVSGGLSGPSGRCPAVVNKNTLTCLEFTQPMGLFEGQRLGKQPPSPKPSLLAQVGSLFSPGGRRVPPAPFLDSESQILLAGALDLLQVACMTPQAPVGQLWRGPPPLTCTHTPSRPAASS